MDSDVEQLFREFRRIGFEPEDVPVLAITVSLEEFFSRLRAIPDGAGLEAFEALLRAMPKPEDPEWNVCPRLGPLFTPAEWHAAWVTSNASPGHLVEHVARHPDRTVYELALLWYFSAGVAARVDAYRADLRARRLAAGDADVADRADVEFETWKERHRSFLANIDEEDARVRGPIVWFQLSAGLSPDASTRSRARCGTTRRPPGTSRSTARSAPVTAASAFVWASIPRTLSACTRGWSDGRTSPRRR